MREVYRVGTTVSSDIMVSLVFVYGLGVSRFLQQTLVSSGINSGPSSMPTDSAEEGGSSGATTATAIHFL